MKINLIVLKTSRPEELVEFYAQLGINFENHKHGNGPLHYAAEIAGVVFEIYPLPNNMEKADNTLRLGFMVDNLNGLVDKIRESGRNPNKKSSTNGMGLHFNY